MLRVLRHTIMVGHCSAWTRCDFTFDFIGFYLLYGCDLWFYINYTNNFWGILTVFFTFLFGCFHREKSINYKLIIKNCCVIETIEFRMNDSIQSSLIQPMNSHCKVYIVGVAFNLGTRQCPVQDELNQVPSAPCPLCSTITRSRIFERDMHGTYAICMSRSKSRSPRVKWPGPSAQCPQIEPEVLDL